MSSVPSGIERRYGIVLKSYLSSRRDVALDEALLAQAYALGREALKDGIGVLEVAMLHHQALAEIAAGGSAATALSKAADFLAECLSPFEMSLRGYQETNARLTSLNETLEEAYSATRTANAQLRAEMVERQRAEEALLHGQKLQVVGQLAGGVAHDFDNLLTVILSDLEQAIVRPAADVGIAELLNRALAAATRAAKLTNQLLAFSRRQVLRPETVDAAKHLRDVASMLERTVGGDIAVALDIPDELPLIDIDTDQLTLALLNLGVNARDAMPGGGVLRISARSRLLDDDEVGLKGEYLVIDFADTGAGIPADVLPKVFEPFFTTKEVGAGTGLGLSQVHGFVHQTGGRVDIASAPGKGTTVTLTLPVRTIKDPPAPTEPAETKDIPLTVLLVEDERIVAAVAAAALKRSGIVVKLAYNARMALDFLEHGEAADLVFSDIKMPGPMNGIDLAEWVNANYPGLPVVLTTGYYDAASRAAPAGVKIIGKPYRTDDLAPLFKTLVAASARY